MDLRSLLFVMATLSLDDHLGFKGPYNGEYSVFKIEFVQGFEVLFDQRFFRTEVNTFVTIIAHVGVLALPWLVKHKWFPLFLFLFPFGYLICFFFISSITVFLHFLFFAVWVIAVIWQIGLWLTTKVLSQKIAASTNQKSGTPQERVI